jgi:hypothetical protein
MLTDWIEPVSSTNQMMFYLSHLISLSVLSFPSEPPTSISIYIHPIEPRVNIHREALKIDLSVHRRQASICHSIDGNSLTDVKEKKTWSILNCCMAVER